MRTVILLFVLVLAPLAARADAISPELRKQCAAAINSDDSFKEELIRVANAETAKQHMDAADRIATNERHVILAYAAMWVVAAGFVMFLWRRQMTLKAQIAGLRRDLEAATKDGK